MSITVVNHGTSIPIRKNGPPNIDASWFNVIRTSLLSGGVIRKVTVTHDSLQAAALTTNVEAFSLPANELILGTWVKHTVAFAGTGITDYQVTLGIGADLDKYLGPFDVFQAVGDTVADVQFGGVIPESFSVATSIKIAATAVGANLDQSTAGSVDLWVFTITLP